MRGNSGALLNFAGDYVLKHCGNARDQCEWFGYAKKAGLVDGVALPYVELVTPTAYKIEYVAGCSGTMLTATQDLERLAKLVEYWRCQPAQSVGSWNDYLERLEGHVAVCESVQMRRAFELASRYDLPGSFNHGDLTLENVLVRNDGEMVLIDPNYSRELFQSWVLDYGKLLQSVHSDYHRVFNSSPGSNPESLLKYLKGYLVKEGIWQECLLAELTHVMRLRKYRPESEWGLVDRLLEKIMQEMK